jgi:hypothetical protein
LRIGILNGILTEVSTAYSRRRVRLSLHYTTGT